MGKRPIGAIVGRLRGLSEGMKQELAERVRAEETLRQRNRELALLNRASQAFSVTLDLDQVLATVLEEVRRLMGVVACSVWLIDPASDELICRQATGPQSKIVRGWRLAPGEGFAGWVARHGESLTVPDARGDERHSQGVGQQTGLALRSIISVPLKASARACDERSTEADRGRSDSRRRLSRVGSAQGVKQDVIGVLQVMDTEADRFTTTDLTLLESLSASAAIAIDNARLVEALRQRTAELEARNKELERFTYVASHNLRTPLVNLKGFAAELRAALAVIGSAVSTALPHLDEKRRPAVIIALQEDVPEALGFIDSSVTHMDNLIKALLRLSYLGHRELDPEPIDMHALVQAALETLAHQIAERQVKVTVGSLPEVVADRTSMEQIMGNLLNNAVLYLAPDRPGEVEVTAESKRGETTFHIRDNGRGIAEEDMHKVFAPFRRAGRRDVPGEGMGLVYVQTLIRRHGGRIWCESELGVGTTFSFTISNHPAKV